MTTPALGTPVHSLPVAPTFAKLPPNEKLYAHYLSRAAWAGARIIMSQVSPESEAIFDFIMEMHRACGGKWDRLLECRVSHDDIDKFLEYSAHFLCSLGNYYAEGDQKFVPDLTPSTLRRMATISDKAADALDAIIEPMLSHSPSMLGFAGSNTQSSYYPATNTNTSSPVTQSDATAVDAVLARHLVEPENTRILKLEKEGKVAYEVLVASVAPLPRKRLGTTETGAAVHLVYGDHGDHLERVNASLLAAANVAPSMNEETMLKAYVEAFTTGSQLKYRESQKLWVGVQNPNIETVFGFVEQYRDPAGVRGEWQAGVYVIDEEATTRLFRLTTKADGFISLLPWAKMGVNGNKGPFEPTDLHIPNFTIVHALSVGASAVWEAFCLPNYADIKEKHGPKNITSINRMLANSTSAPTPFLHPSLAASTAAINSSIRFIVTAIHELLGHSSGKLLAETAPGVYNFDITLPPDDPLTGEPVTTWYKPGQTWYSVFGKVAGSAEKCRAMLVSYYLVDNRELLGVLGVFDMVDDFVYHTYVMIAVWGINALHSYNAEEAAWSQPHARANWAILRHLLADVPDLVTITHDASKNILHANVDRSKVLTHGRPSLGRMLCKIHVWRCTANVANLVPFYEDLSAVRGVHEQWRLTVSKHQEPRWKFLQANTVLADDGSVRVKTYDKTNAGIVQSYAERVI